MSAYEYRTKTQNTQARNTQARNTQTKSADTFSGDRNTPSNSRRLHPRQTDSNQQTGSHKQTGRVGPPSAFTQDLAAQAPPTHTAFEHKGPSQTSLTAEQAPHRYSQSRDSQSGFVVENLKISGDALLGKVNDLIGQGNVHRIVIKNKEGHTLLSVPTSIKAMGSSLDTILSSEATAINIISAIVPYPKLVVEKFVEQYL